MLDSTFPLSLPPSLPPPPSLSFPLSHIPSLSLFHTLLNPSLSAVNHAMITVHPVSLFVVRGQSATFTVTAMGSNLMYQWQKDGVNITTGANSATYSIAAVAESDEGEYRCVVSNAANSVTSTAASLTVCKLVHHY